MLKTAMKRRWAWKEKSEWEEGRAEEGSEEWAWVRDEFLGVHPLFHVNLA
jgi:hypothetical protein